MIRSERVANGSAGKGNGIEEGHVDDVEFKYVNVFSMMMKRNEEYEKGEVVEVVVDRVVVIFSNLLNDNEAG